MDKYLKWKRLIGLPPSELIPFRSRDPFVGPCRSIYARRNSWRMETTNGA